MIVLRGFSVYNVEHVISNKMSHQVLPFEGLGRSSSLCITLEMPATTSRISTRNCMDTIKVIVVDEQPLFRQGICSTLERMGNCEIIGKSTDALEILELARTGNPDVALIDAGLTAADPLEIARQMRHIAPQVATMILTPSEDEERLF